MTTLADLVSITTDPGTGAEILTVRQHGYKLLGGAALYDLVDRRRLGREGEGNATRVVVLDASPVPEPSLEYGMRRVRRHARQRPRNAVLRLGGGVRLRGGIHGGLVTEGVLGPSERSGLFSPPRHRVLDPARREALIAGLGATMLGGSRPDETTRRLAGLLAVADGDSGPLLGIVLDAACVPVSGPARNDAARRAMARCMDIVRTDWIALTTLRAVKLPQQLAAIGGALGLADAMIPR